MTFDGISQGRVPVHLLKEDKPKKNTQEELEQESIFMDVKEYHEKALSVQINTIGKYINEALEKGLLTITLPFEIFYFVEAALLKLGWMYAKGSGKTFLSIGNIDEYAKRRKEDKPIKIKGDVFLSTEEYYRKVRMVQIDIINREIENCIKSGKNRIVVSNIILPELQFEFEKAGWENKNGTVYTISYDKQRLYIKDIDVEKLTKDLNIKQDE